MSQKTTYRFLLFIILTMNFVVSCSPEKAKTSSLDLDDNSTEILVDKKKTNFKSEEINDSSEVIFTESKEPMDNVKNTNPTTDNETGEIQEKDTSSLQRNITSENKKPKKKKVKNKKRPKIEFEELVWDFGEIIEGDIIEKKFKFTNTGSAPLEIIATSATCGCTRPSFPFLEIAPGESNVIGVNYNSVGKDGEQDPEVTIESNTYPKTTTIKLHGIVKPKPKKETLVKDSVKLGN